MRQERLHTRRNTEPFGTREAGHPGEATCRDTDGSAGDLEGRTLKDLITPSFGHEAKLLL
ncbi:hypothetical protein MESS2_1030159 [Mesorhizobium metallidurans STM 2683]|uniref:Uncharacterized protein n=1 Tax=Mesorhizobium metallidurans STM 2683 TaxID=1297569 RepID=M5EG31_9HYPH|nr:hypothetical protein MESS2_1030159 [Mesorhizobium metallidurans STM 2683]